MPKTEAVRDNLDASDTWLHRDDDQCRVLDVFYTDQGTKLFVKDGVLVEEKIESSSPKSHGPVDYDSDIPECFRGQVFTYYRDPPEPPAPKEDAEKHATQQTISLAIPALEYYNRKQRTNYKLVDPLCSNGVLLDGIWYHCNFTASEPSQDGRADSAPKLFFAELKIARVTKDAAVYSVKTCCRLANGKSTTRCDMCDGDELLHPTNGRFLQGTCDREHSLRPRRNH